MTGADPEILDELLQNALEIQSLDHPERPTADRLSTDELVDVLRHGELLAALLESPLDRRDLEARLDVSRATAHRFTRWLDEQGYAERVDGVYRLTGEGEVVTEAVLQFERKIRTADRLAPLLDAVCEDHREFIVEPFEDATVTVAAPSNPYAPMARFLALLRDCERFRGFNTTHMVPPGLEEADGDPFADREVELISLPSVVRAAEETDDRVRQALDGDHLKLLTRDALPYGLALFDSEGRDRVGVGGYDEETGAMRVFVDTDTAIARAWAERVYETFRADATPIAAAEE